MGSGPRAKAFIGPDGAAGQWLAREAPEVVSLHGLNACPAPQSPLVPPADVCPLRRPPTGACVKVRPAASGRRDQDSECLLRVAPRHRYTQQLTDCLLACKQRPYNLRWSGAGPRRPG